MFPWTYGRLGVALGPLLGAALQGVMLLLSVVISRVAVELQCCSFGELGEALGGKWGGHLLRGSQILNNALFMPVALILSAEALRQIGLVAHGCTGTNSESSSSSSSTCEWWSCNVNTLLLLIGLAWPILLLARDVGHLGFVSLVSLVLIAMQGVTIMLYAVFVPPYGMSVESYQWFGASGSPSWADEISAIGTFLYSFCPMFLAVEVSASMEQPTQISRALVFSFLYNQAMYVPLGLSVVAFWGGAVTDPVTLAMSTGAASIISNLILLGCTFLDYAIVGALLNRELQLSLLPKFDRSCTWANMPIWFALTSPSLIFSLLLALFVPKLDALKGLLTAFCVPSAMLFGPAGLVLYRLYRQPVSAAAATDAALATAKTSSTAGRAILFGGFVLGVTLLVAIVAQTIRNIVYDTKYDGPYFCEQVAAP